jgi:hypothetical protein
VAFRLPFTGDLPVPTTFGPPRAPPPAFSYKRDSRGTVWAKSSRTGAVFYQRAGRWVPYHPVPRGPALSANSGTLSASRATPPPQRQSQQTGLQAVTHTIASVTNNPVVQGGLDGLGAALGDPDLGQQVGQAARVLDVVVAPIASTVADFLMPDSLGTSGGMPVTWSKEVTTAPAALPASVAFKNSGPGGLPPRNLALAL